jgi:hypothetical protein
MKNKNAKRMIAGQCTVLIGLKFWWEGRDLFFMTKKTKIWPARKVTFKHYGGACSLTADQLRGK